MPIPLDHLAREISELARRLRGYGEDVRVESVLPSRWTLSGDSLLWHVRLTEELLEPDLDIEIVTNALIVRARPSSGPRTILVSILPVPRMFDVHDPEIRYRSTSLEITLKPVKGEAH